MKKLTFLKSLLLGVLMTVSANMYALGAGDIAIIAVNTDATKTFTFVALADIPASTTISFTDNAWDASTPAWRAGEGTIQWSHTANVTAGTVITVTLTTTPTVSIGNVTKSGSFDLSASGDQILAYQGTTAPTTNPDANWLFAFSTENFVWGNNSNTSDVPTSLTAASVAMTTSATETDNAYFANGSTAQSSVTVSGTKSELLALFTDASKYYKNDAGALTIPTYTITVNSSSNPVAATPEFSPAAGTYTSAQSVTISCATSGASIYYTTDGSDPDNTKTQYTGAISVTSTTTIKARAYASGYDPSAIASATYTINVAPTITVTEVTLPAFSATAGSSQDQTITVNGSNLTGNITLALSGTDAAAFSLSESSITPTAGSVTDKVITITYAPTAPGSHSATLTLSSSGATDVTRDLTGTATLAKPTVNTASNIGKTALTLNWNAVSGATSYEVNVYTKDGSGESTLLSEDFSKFTAGSPNGSADGTDISDKLDTYTLVPGWTGSKVYQAGGTAKMGTSSALGYLVTPSLDLSGGEVTLSFKAMAWAGDATELKIYVDDALAYTATGLNNTDYTLSSYSTTLTGGTTASKIKFEGKQASKGRLFLDDVVVTKSGSKTPISGSPFTTTETSLQVSDLTAATTYYYTVTAKNGTYVSPASDEASASTLGTATSNVSVQGIFVRNGKVIVTAPAAGESIEIFNAVGQRLVSTLSTAGENEIAVPAKGILLVKAGSQVTKVMMP
ncbi:MAG: hypothetical protein GX429_01790 [Bacteroidales bacterium]|nr:hypothetical protein [Bacteroidales bacterium]